MMKRIITFLLAMIMALAIVSCKRSPIVEDLISENITENQISQNSETDVTVSEQNQDSSPQSTNDAVMANSKPSSPSKTTQNPHSNQKATVTMSHWIAGGTTEKTSVNTVLAQMKKDYPNINVKVNFVSGDYSTKMYANLAAKKEPDVFMVADGDFGKWVKAGVLENLTPYVNKSKAIDISQMWASAITRYSYDGKVQGKGNLYAMPKDISPRVLFYNKDLLKKYGVAEPSKTQPMTYDQFVDFLKKLAHPNDGVWGIPSLNWEGWIRSSGTSLLSADHKSSNLNDPKLWDVFQKLSDLIHVYKVTPTSAKLDSEGAMIMFQTQKAACFDGAIYNVITARDFEFEWDVCPLPGGIESPYAAGYTGSVGYGVSKRSSQMDAAYMVAEYFCTRTAQKLLCEIGFNIPLYKDMANSSVFLKANKKPANAAAFIKAAEYQQPLDVTYTDNDQWYTVLGNRLQPLWNDANSKAAVLVPSLKSEIDRLLK